MYAPLRTRSRTSPPTPRDVYAIYAYIDPPSHPNVGKYASHTECLGTVQGERRN